MKGKDQTPWQSSGQSGLCTFTAEVPGQGTKIPQAAWCSKKKKKENPQNGIIYFFSGGRQGLQVPTAWLVGSQLLGQGWSSVPCAVEAQPPDQHGIPWNRL